MQLEGDEGARVLLTGPDVRELPLDEIMFADVDTWDDYRALLERD